MQNSKQNYRFPLTWFAGVAGVILALGGATAWWAKYSLDHTNQPTVNKNATTTVEQSPTVSENEPLSQRQEQVAICWLDPTESKIELVSKTLIFPKSVTKDGILKSAFDQLLAGPSKSANYTTTIPQGTKLLDLTATEEGVKVNLSQEFVAGGGSAAMSGRLAQILYTASSLDPNTRVWISVEGEPLVNLGGEGITLSQPMTRQEFQDNFSL